MARSSGLFLNRRGRKSCSKAVRTRPTTNAAPKKIRHPLRPFSHRASAQPAPRASPDTRAGAVQLPFAVLFRLTQAYPRNNGQKRHWR
ncbi:MAG: hypothetical protein EBZ83_04100 [Verrucomicrobia bacterium]|nr:hypothetical protein [Verrucomicrobiota bacterium]